MDTGHYQACLRVNFQCDTNRGGAVVECLTRDRGAAGSRLTEVTALWSILEQDTFILA